jgi:hypothetical protein
VRDPGVSGKTFEEDYMQLWDLDYFKERRLLKIIVAILVTILLGAIGSGLWERLLSSFVDKIAFYIMSVLASTFHGYVDYIHGDIGKGLSGRFVLLSPLAILMFFITFPWLLILYYYRMLESTLREISDQKENRPPSTEDEIKIKIQGRKKKIARLMIPLACVSSILYISELIETTYTYKAALFVDRSIEILAPYVSSKDVVSLRSEYRSIDSADKFYTLEEKLRAHAKSSNITLPKFKSIK